MSDVAQADKKMQLELTTYTQAELPRLDALRRRMGFVAEKHFSGKPFNQVADTPAPRSVLKIWQKMCDFAEQNFTGYIPPRVEVQ